MIGSGLVGLNAALRLRELAPKARIVVVERGSTPLGASTRNAGFACFGSLTELLEDQSLNGEAQMWALVEKRWRGLQKLRQRLGDRAIQYRPYGGYELFQAGEAALFETCVSAMPDFNARLKELTGLEQTYQTADTQLKRFGFNGIQHLIWNAAEGQLHTGKMMQVLLQKVHQAKIEIWNGIDVRSIADTGQEVAIETTQDWGFKAQKVLVATNGFSRRLLMELEVIPARNQVLITTPIPGLKIKGSFHYDRGYYYFRNIDGRILLGGGRNLDPLAEQTDAFGTTEKIRTALLRLLETVILPGQEIKIDGWWSGILGIGSQKKPIVQAVSKNIVTAVRLGGMGVAIGALVGEEGADLLMADAGEFGHLLKFQVPSIKSKNFKSNV